MGIILELMGVWDQLQNTAKVASTRPGKHTKNCGKSPFFMGKSSVSMGHVP